ncbi:MAG: ABC transporter ATP-binding protein [Terricaulis sp.]
MSALLSLRGVSMRLRDREVVSGVSLEVAQGDVVALLGPNGAGKTSLLRGGLGFVALASGSASLRGGDPHKLTARDRALRAAYLPQRPQSIWPISVENLVALGRFAYGAAPDRLAPADKAAVEAALTSCGLAELRNRRMDEISGGEKARAHLARALAQQASLLALDEPTAGLDPAQALAVAEILKAQAANGAVIFSTHDVGLAAQTATRVLLMREGRVVAEGSPKAALTAENLQAAYGRKGRVIDVDGNLAAVFE